DVPVRYLPYPHLGTRLAGSYFVLAALAARLLRPDLVYTRNLRIADLCARLGLDVLVETHAVPRPGRQQRAAARLVGHRRLRRWVVISERLRVLTAAVVPGLPAARLVVAHDAVDVARFASPGPRPAGLPRGPLVVHAGHLYPGRGAELLARAAAA